MSGTVLYDDGGLVLDEDGVTIRRYYFPWAGSKRISYRELRHAEARPMGALTGQGHLGDHGSWLLAAAGLKAATQAHPRGAGHRPQGSARGQRG